MLRGNLRFGVGDHPGHSDVLAQIAAVILRQPRLQQVGRQPAKRSPAIYLAGTDISTQLMLSSEGPVSVSLR